MWFPKDLALGLALGTPQTSQARGVGVLSLPLEQVDSSSPGIRIGILD